MPKSSDDVQLSDEPPPPGVMTDLTPSSPDLNIQPSQILRLNDSAQLTNFLQADFKQVPELHHQMGLERVLNSLTLQVVSDLATAKSLWHEFSPKKSLFDTWEFRYTFHQHYQYQLYFYLLFNQTENLALLPLCFAEDKQQYFWFGSDWQEDNRFLVKEPIFIPFLLALAPKPLLLNAIPASALASLLGVLKVQADDPKYVCQLNGIKSVEDFLKNLKKKKRYNLRRDWRIIAEQQPVVEYDRFEDLEQLIILNRDRFENRGIDSGWYDQRKVAVFRNLLNLKQINPHIQVRMISVRIAGQLAAVDLIMLYKDTYYALKGGNNLERFPGIGNYMFLLDLEDALKLKAHKIDFLGSESNWKASVLKEVALYKFEKS